jgi:Amt family ammonium transporter
MSWLIVEKLREGKATTLGIASGAIAGAVAITPACGFVTPIGALFIGLFGGAVSAWAVTRKYRLGYDDSLDVVGVHGVGGLIGMIGIGLLASKLVNSGGADGLFVNGSFSQLNKQLIASVMTAAYSFAATWLIATFIQKTIGFRVDRNTELEGLDTTIHAESAYDINNYTTR